MSLYSLFGWDDKQKVTIKNQIKTARSKSRRHPPERKNKQEIEGKRGGRKRRRKRRRRTYSIAQMPIRKSSCFFKDMAKASSCCHGGRNILVGICGPTSFDTNPPSIHLNIVPEQESSHWGPLKVTDSKSWVCRWGVGGDTVNSEVLLTAPMSPKEWH